MGEMATAAGYKGRADQAIPVRKRPGTSLHHQIFLVLRDQIINGQYEAGSPLPSEDELSRLFRVSRVTIRAALASLDSEGLVEKRQGVGTFVTKGRTARLHTPVADLIAQIAEIGRNTSVTLLEFDYVRAPAHVQSIFGCGNNTIFQRALRLRHAGTRPIFYITTYVPQSLSKNFSREQLEAMTLYRLLLQSGVVIASASQVVSAQLADPIVAPLLDVAVGAPLLQVRRQYREESGDLIGYVEILASPAQFEVHMALDAQELGERA
jgi:GntR family transcriptional regulator